MKDVVFSIMLILLSLSFSTVALAEGKLTIECGGYYSAKGLQSNGEPILIRSNHQMLEHGDLILIFESYLASSQQNMLYPLEYRFVKSESVGSTKKIYYFVINQFGKPETAQP